MNVNVNSNALQLARVIMGPGAVISNASFIGSPGAVGTFSGNNNMGINYFFFNTTKSTSCFLTVAVNGLAVVPKLWLPQTSVTE